MLSVNVYDRHRYVSIHRVWCADSYNIRFVNSSYVAIYHIVRYKL